MAILEVENLKTWFHTRDGVVKAVDGISFDLAPGKILGIVGESGSGKSVTVHSLMGLVPQPPGRIEDGSAHFDGSDLIRCAPRELRAIRGKRIAMIFQDPMTSLNPYLRISEQLIEPLLIHGLAEREQALKKAIAMLEKVGIRDAAERIHSYPHEFSGGMRQRVMIAMALITDPEMLIADEPTTALDVTVQAQILRLLKELQADLGVSVIFITHDLGVIAELADRVVVMYRGHIVEQGDVLSIFDHPQHPYTKGLLACRPRLESTFKVLPTVSDYLDEMEVGGQVELSEKPDAAAHIESLQQVADSEIDENDLLLEVRGLQVHFSERAGFFFGPKGLVKAVDGISFTVPRGSTLGLVGESGCGKTTTGRAILNLVAPTEGSVQFDGQEIAGFDAAAMLPLRKRMQIIFQDPYSSLNPRLTIEQALTEPMSVHGIGRHHAERRDRAAALLDEVGLDARFLRRYPHEFSGGQRQRICVARALSLEPEFILCDEAVSAMDVSVQAQVLNLLKELQLRRNLTYIFISHDLSVVKFMADTMAVMEGGRIIEQGNAEEIYANPSEAYTRRLIDAIPRDSVSFIRERVG
ncbi:MAG TPA: ABC transporter ATP-binding protein [Verrucomicrobiales bacterium]|nr:ABC transporter ATP-binding protein [Verrucomicrobiales bacterium]|tara:strand:+ start:4579 stop:6324 length:1746 start_codon:yes stop_codon:yes gene_type:complete